MQRKDDAPETAVKRLGVFQADTKPVLAHYQAQGKVEEINGDRHIVTVACNVGQVVCGSYDGT